MPPYEPISVCIPAHNEEATIGSTLDSILRQDYPGEMEITVCANACTDGTEEEVRRLQTQHPNLHLLSTPEKGKPNAWNMLRETATHDYHFFTDADVTVHPTAFRHLYHTLESRQDLVAAGGMIVPYLEESDWLTSLITPKPGPQGCLIGRLYAYHEEKLKSRMQHWGYPQMPSDIIHEDAWLSLVIGIQQWTTHYEAKVYYYPWNWSEAIQRQAQEKRGIQQLKQDYPHLLNERPFWEEPALQRRLAKLQHLHGVRDFIEYAAGRPLRIFIRWRASRLPNPSAPTGWYSARSSKRIIPLSRIT